jgi:hypothetical protein
VAETGQPYAYTGDDPVNGVDPLGLFWGEGTLDKWRHDTASDADAQWNAVKSFATGLVGTPTGCKTNQAAYDIGNISWWGAAIGGLLGNTAASSGSDGSAVDSGSLTVVGDGFSESEQAVAQMLAEQGNEVVLREATGVGPTSDLLVNGTPYDVYTPTTSSVDRIVSAVASKGPQVSGGGVVIDLSNSSLTVADLGNILVRVQGVTSQISHIIVVK